MFLIKFPLADVFFCSFVSLLSYCGGKDPTQDGWMMYESRMKSNVWMDGHMDGQSRLDRSHLDKEEMVSFFYGEMARACGYRLSVPRLCILLPGLKN